MVIFLLFAYFSSIAEGGGGLVATNTAATLTETATTVQVVSTTGFLSASSIIVEDEEIAYSSINSTYFLGCTRGYRATDAKAHLSGKVAYSPETGVLNRALGFSVVSTGEAYGTLAVINLTWTFMAKAIGYLVTFNFGILGGQLVYLRYLLMAPAVGFVVYMGFTAMGTAFGILRK